MPSVEYIDITPDMNTTLDIFKSYCDTTIPSRDSGPAKQYTSEKHLNECISSDIPIGTDQYKRNIKFDAIDRFNLIQDLADMFSDHSIQLSGNFLYPPGGFMSWHTNSNTPGDRVYLTYATETDKSFFRYRDSDGNIRTSYDKSRWIMRRFHVDSSDLLWHCVYSDTFRLSIGFRLMKNLKS